jgi:hypothetical protein
VDNFKQYVMETLKKSKGNAYRILSTNNSLVEFLDNKYPNILDFKTKIRLYVHDLDDYPRCSYSGCNNLVSFVKTFNMFCSRKCDSLHKQETNFYEYRNEKIRQTNLERYGVESYSQTDEYLSKVKQTNLDRYGVENYSQTEEFSSKVKKTNLERYGVENPMMLDEFKEKMVNGVFKKHGVESYSQTEEYLSKVKKTNLERYGVDHPMKLPEIRDKQIRTNQERYGVNSYSQTEEYLSKVKKTNLERYGVENYSQTNDFAEKIRQTNLERYGVNSYSQTEEYLSKVKKTNLERYGVENYFQSDEFKRQFIEIMNSKYGANHPMKSTEVLSSVKSTNVLRYGVEYPIQSEDIKEKIKQTNLERYGVDSYPKTSCFNEKTKKTNLERYGVESYYQSDFYRNKENDIKEKIKQTNLERYGVEFFGRKDYNEDYKDVFDDISKFKELLNEHGTYKLAEMINCNVSTIYTFVSNNNINLPPRSRSHQEEIIIDFLVQNNISFISNSRKILPSGKELDFYFPDYNFAIEFNGLYWHSEISGGKDKNYHYDKWKECDALGITLLSICEDEFVEKQNFWLNKILYMTGKLSLTKIHARKCEIRELDNVTEFLNEHHLQGSNSSRYKFGLFYNNQLVSVMTFSKPRDNKNKTIDLSRFCNHSEYLVSGGASKLLSYFLKNYGHLYESVVSFSDNSYSNGNVYMALGFDLVNNLKPDYKYTISNKTFHKSGFRKSSIFKKFDIPENLKNISEWGIMQYLGYDRIWDCGKKKWEIKIPS